MFNLFFNDNLHTLCLDLGDFSHLDDVSGSGIIQHSPVSGPGWQHRAVQPRPSHPCVGLRTIPHLSSLGLILGCLGEHPCWYLFSLHEKDSTKEGYKRWLHVTNYYQQ